MGRSTQRLVDRPRAAALLASSTKGWRDRSVAISGGGIEAAQVKLAFDGKAYPGNPTVLPSGAKVNAADGDELIADPFAE